MIRVLLWGRPKAAGSEGRLPGPGRPGAGPSMPGDEESPEAGPGHQLPDSPALCQEPPMTWHRVRPGLRLTDRVAGASPPPDREDGPGN